MTPLARTLLTTLAVLAATMPCLWLISRRRRDVSLVDVFWGVGFIMTAWIAWRLNAPADARTRLLVGLTTVWGLRLSLYLLWRNWGRGEDRRYAAMRERQGDRFARASLFTVFYLQGAILWFISLPIQVAAAGHRQTSLGWIDVLGLALFVLGFVFESVGDWQLARFQSNRWSMGRVMDRGLWRFTRHPNYFGDFCVWWGLYLISAAGGAGWTTMSPLLMSILLMRVSGVSLLEKDITERRPEYVDYMARTNAFFPGPPRHLARRNNRSA